MLTCSATAKVNGWVFNNAENESFGPIEWQQAFAKSCNTWFVQLQAKVPLRTLVSTARLFGFATATATASAQAAG